MGRSSRKQKALRANAAPLLKLLRQRPLPLRALVTAIASDPVLVSLVLRAAGTECATPPGDVESAVVLLGAEGLRGALARQDSPRNAKQRGGEPARRRPVGPTAGRLRRLRQAITRDQYRVNPRALAAAMLREFERS